MQNEEEDATMCQKRTLQVSCTRIDGPLGGTIRTTKGLYSEAHGTAFHHYTFPS